MPGEIDSGGEESPGVLSDDHDHPPDSPDSNSTDPPDNSKGFPWLKVCTFMFEIILFYIRELAHCNYFMFNKYTCR